MNRLDLILVFSSVIGVLYLGAGIRGRLPGPKVAGFSLIPSIAGSVLLAYLVWNHGAQMPALLGRATAGPRNMVLAAAATIGAGAVAHFLFTWCLDTPHALVSRLGRTGATGGSRFSWLRSLVLGVESAVLVLGLVAVLGLARQAAAGSGIQSSVEGLVRAVYPLPGGPTDLVFVDESSGYIAVDIDFFTAEERSEIYRFELPLDGGEEIALERVAEGLSFARGLAFLRDTLYVTDQGVLPCEGLAFIQCISGLDPESGEPNSLRMTRGRLLAFPVNPDGSLGPSSVVLDDLPVVNSEHSLQDVEVGPDGRLFLSIGGPGQIARDPTLIENTDRPNLDLLGTIVSFDTDGSNLEVYARGLRNVFQFAFDEQGELFGAENDGPGARAWKFEEVLHIKRGANYGFPYEGTFDRGVVRTDAPLWIQNTVGSAGFEWSGRVGLAPGLLMGSEKRIAYLALAQDEFGYHVRNKTDITNLITLSAGNVTALKAGPRPGQLLAGVYANESKLLLLDFSQAAAGSMVALTCTGCHGPDLTGTPGLGPNLTRHGNLSGWSEADFINAMRTGYRPDGTLLDGQRMPWLQFSQLPEEDLVALWSYLSSELRAPLGGA